MEIEKLLSSKKNRLIERITIAISEDTYTNLVALEESKGIKAPALVRALLDEFFEQNEVSQREDQN